MTPLFLDNVHKPTFQKLAMPVKLSESPEAWQRDIAGEIYKQLPFIGEYAVNVILDRVDAQRGFGFGSVHVSNKSDSPLPDQSEMPSIRIPIVVRDYLMAPLDIFMDGNSVYPLTESRVREVLFRPETFETSTRKPADKGLVDQLYPPMRSNYGMGSLGGDTMGMGKSAADAEQARRAMIGRMHGEAAANPSNIGTKMASLVDAISSTISEKDADALVDQITNDMEIKVAAARNAHFRKMAMKLISEPRTSVEKTAAALVESIKPNVVQLEKLASGDFRVKWANSQAFMPQEGQVGPQEASSMAGGDLSGMKPGATITLSSEKAQKQSLEEPVFEKITKFGQYEVQNMDSGEMLTGWVLPIIDMEMQPLDMYVFISPVAPPAGEAQGQMPPTTAIDNMESGGAPGAVPASPAPAQPDADKGIKTAGMEGMSDPSGAPAPAPPQQGATMPAPQDAPAPAPQVVWGAQDDIAGQDIDGDLEAFMMAIDPQQTSDMAPAAPPQGSGVFVSLEGKCCLLPMTIQNGAVGPDGSQTFQAEDLFGMPMTIQQTEGIMDIQEIGERSYAIPTKLTWVSLPGQPVFLAKDPLDVMAKQEAQGMPNQVDVGSTGQGEFSMDGPPLSKVAADKKQFIKTAEAEFLLVAMGIGPFEARGILKKASQGHKVKCAGRQIVSLASLHTRMTKQAANELGNFPYQLRQNLVKEASVIDDADTADKVLAMNFINPENISTFAKYLPELDEASQKLAELLLAVRLGVGSVDEGAVERAMKGIEVVIDGLKMLQQKAIA